MVKRIFFRKVYKKSRKKRRLFLILEIAAFCILFFIVSSLAVFIYFAKDLPRPEKFTEKDFAESTKIFDRTGEVLLYELYGEEKREVVPLSEISEHIKNAVISTEDADFYSHFGIDFKGIFRSIQINLRIRKATYGGSTIGQQLIRSTFLTSEKTIKRKVREIILTLELERRHSKDQILEWYLNQVPFGPNLYGVESASKALFKKSAKDVSLPEAAVLAALIKAPSYYSPYGQNKDALFIRKDYVLKRMTQEGYISLEKAETAKQENLEFSEVTCSIKAPHFIFHVENYLFEKYGQDFLEKGGFKIYTSLDWNLQEKAEEIVLKGVQNNKGYRAHNAALTAIDPGTGEILAMVGSADWFGDPWPEDCTSGLDCLFDPKVNVATYGTGRQPGSAFKPFVYATAFEKGYDDKHIVIDEKTNFGIYGGKAYIPQNYDGLFRGPVTLRQGLAQSLNVPSVKVLAYLAGLNDAIKTAQKMGITTLTKPSSFYGLAIVLGGGEAKLLDMVSSYGVFAAEGTRIPPVSVIKIEDSDGYIIEENKKTPKRVLSIRSARIINDILSDNEARTPMFGPVSSMYFENYDIAAKTGTTNDYKDAWIIGYSPSIVAGVWVGNNDNTSMRTQPAVVLSGPIWKEFLNYALPLMPKETFTKPD